MLFSRIRRKRQECLNLFSKYAAPARVFHKRLTLIYSLKIFIEHNFQINPIFLMLLIITDDTALPKNHLALLSL
jgi:hypothetical protein